MCITVQNAPRTLTLYNRKDILKYQFILYVSGSHDKSLESHWLIIMGRESNRVPYFHWQKLWLWIHSCDRKLKKLWKFTPDFYTINKSDVLGWAFVHDFWVYYTLVVLLDIGKKRYSVLWSPLSLRKLYFSKQLYESIATLIAYRLIEQGGVCIPSPPDVLRKRLSWLAGMLLPCYY